MRSLPSNPSHHSSNASVRYSSRSKMAGVRWLRSVSDNNERKRQSDNAKRQPSWQAACETVSAAWCGLVASKPRQTTLMSTVLAKAGFFYKTPLASMAGIVKMTVKNFYACALQNTARTRKIFRPCYLFEKTLLLVSRRVLIILWSLVRVQHGPP